MTTEPRSTRQALDWLPVELIPDDSERGYRTIQHNPVPNPSIGGWTFTMHGYTPRPTVTDGYHATSTVELDSASGATVTRLVVEPSATIQETDGTHRQRDSSEMRLSPVNTSVLGLIRFTDIAQRIAEIEKEYALFLSADLPEASAEATARAESVHRRGPQKDLAAHARYAEQALHSTSQGRGYQARLRDLYPIDWPIGIEATRKRIARLRQDGWLHSVRGVPGPLLVEWRKDHGDDHWHKESK